MPKKTRLDDSAEIYKQRTDKTEREKLKEMNMQEKLAYLWEYYKTHALVTIIAIAFIIYIIKEIITPDVVPKFNAAIINSPINTVELTEYGDSFEEWLQLSPERESVILNDNFYTDFGMGYTSIQTLVAYVSAGDLDVIIAPETEFAQYAKHGYFKNLSEALPTDVYSNLANYFYFSDLQDDPEKNPYGIYLDNSNLFKGKKYNSSSYVLGIVLNCPNADNSVEFIKYLFRNEQE